MSDSEASGDHSEHAPSPRYILLSHFMCNQTTKQQTIGFTPEALAVTVWQDYGDSSIFNMLTESGIRLQKLHLRGL